MNKNVRLPARDIELAEELGNGNCSAGVRRALALVRLVKHADEHDRDQTVSELIAKARVLWGER